MLRVNFWYRNFFRSRRSLRNDSKRRIVVISPSLNLGRFRPAARSLFKIEWGDGVDLDVKQHLAIADKTGFNGRVPQEAQHPTQDDLVLGERSKHEERDVMLKVLLGVLSILSLMATPSFAGGGKMHCVKGAKGAEKEVASVKDAKACKKAGGTWKKMEEAAKEMKEPAAEEPAEEEQ